VTLLNLDTVVLGGSAGRGAARLWLPRIRRQVVRLSLPTAAQRVKIATGALGESAALAGAAWVFLHRRRGRHPVGRTGSVAGTR
jgi:predicted NBD/HSP70 family sugar kinase